MIARISVAAFALLLLLARPVSATPHIGPPPCVTATLDAYIMLGGSGCSIGKEVAFFDFDFSVLALGGGAIPINASDILVTPDLSGLARGLSFTSAGFSVTGAQSVEYLISYSVDPHPILFGFIQTMETFTPVAPGTASITTDLCIGALFQPGPVCAGATDSSTVFHNGTIFDLLDEVRFGGAFAEVGVRSVISLNANGASADIAGFTTTVVPEPTVLWLVTLGAAGVLTRRRRRARR